MENIVVQNDYLLKIINSANEGIYVTDRQRRFLIWNDAAERISGYAREEIIGRACFDNILCHTDGEGNKLCLEKCPLVRTMETGSSFGPALVYLRHKDGRRIPVEVSTAPVLDDNGNVTGGIELFQDITDRLEKERLIREKNRELEAVIDNIREGVLFIDNTGKISLYNSALSEMFSLDSENLKGGRISALPENHQLRQAMIRTHKEFKGPFCWEITRCPKERGDCPAYGSRRCRCWILSSYRTTSAVSRRCVDCLAYRHVKSFLEKPKEFELGPRAFSVLSSFIELREKDEIGEVVVFRDVTVEKRDAIMKCAGGAAHELRQPLQVLVNTVALLEGEISGNEALAGHLDAIKESCHRLNETVKQIGEITQYRTKCYTENRNILDIERSSGEAENNESSQLVP